MVFHFTTARGTMACNTARGFNNLGSTDRAEVTCKRCLAALAKEDARKAARAKKEGTITKTFPTTVVAQGFCNNFAVHHPQAKFEFSFHDFGTVSVTITNL